MNVPFVRHQGHVAHVDVLFLDVLDRPGAGGLVDIEHDQTQRHLQRCGIGHVALLAFVDVVFRLFQLVFHELQHRGLVEVLDREDRLEGALDALAIQRLGAVAGPQEQVVGGFLNLDQVRHLQNFTDFAEVAADALLANVSLRHARRHLSIFRGRAARRATGARRLRRGGQVPFVPPVPPGGSRTFTAPGKRLSPRKPLPRRGLAGPGIAPDPAMNPRQRACARRPITSARPWRQPLRASS